MFRGAATEDASRGGFAYGVGFRAGHRESGSVPVWQADRELPGAGELEQILENETDPGKIVALTRQLIDALDAEENSG
jgi:hypothetical protein